MNTKLFFCECNINTPAFVKPSKIDLYPYVRDLFAEEFVVDYDETAIDNHVIPTWNCILDNGSIIDICMYVVYITVENIDC